MKGKIGVFLFGLPFFGVGVVMMYLICSSIAEAWEMRQWLPAQATLIAAGYNSDTTGKNKGTHSAYAEYTYTVDGRTYTNDRVSIIGISDNIGSYQKDLGSRLAGVRQRGESVTVYVNPEAPGDAIVDRGLRWGLLSFMALFMIVFGGVGLALLVSVFRRPRDDAQSEAAFASQPWLANDGWQTAAVKSNSKMAMYFSWGFALLWNAVSAPLPFIVYEQVLEKNNMAALLGLLFPLVGIGLLIWAVLNTLEWARFGPAPVVLDPFPGAIGGHVGGTIEVNLPYQSAARFELTLTNLYSYISGSGKNRSRKESAKWQDNQVAHSEMGVNGTRLSFRFDVPANLDESDADPGGENYYVWRLNLKAKLPGVDIDRDYDIPVYATGRQSERLSGYSIDRARAEQAQIDDAAVAGLVRLSHGGSGRSMLFPLGRHLYNGLVGMLFGVVFSGAGWFVFDKANSVFMGGVFGLIGLIVFLSGFYYLFNSLEVIQDGSYVKTVRRVLGIAVKRRRMSRSEFTGFTRKSSMQTKSGGKHVMHYSVYANDRSGNRMIVGEGFKGASQADAAIRFIGREFGLTTGSRAAEAPGDDNDTNYLAAEL